MTKIILGNGNDLSVSDDNSNGDTIIVGNGVGDSVSAVGSSNDTITLGNGAGDPVNVGLPLGIVGSSNDTITLGNGDGDTVTAARSNFDTITLGNGVGDTVDSNTLNVDGKDTGFTDTITLQGKGGSHVTIAGGTTNATTLAMSSRDLIGNGTPSIAGRHTGADKLQAGSTSVGGTLDVFGTIDSSVVLPVASSFASDRKIEDATTSATAVADTSADQVLKIDGTDTGSMTTITSGGLALSLSSAIFTDAGSTTTITSGGLTKGNTLTLSGTVSNVNSSVRVYDGATLLGTATFSVEDPRSWGYVTAVLPDGSHSFTVTATDNAGNTATTSAVTATVDATPPSVISVSSRVSGSVKTGKFVQITLKMSEKVTVSGTPGLLLNDGGTATYASGSGTQALTFKYAVPSNQGTSDLRVIGDTLPSPTAIQDLAGNAADLSAVRTDLHWKVGSTTTAPATSMTLTGTQQMELFGPSSANVTFASGATGNLILDASSQFTGTIAGLNSAAPFDTIDLADIAFGSNTTVVYLASSADTGTLTVSDGTHTANIALLGKYSPTSFKIASDDHGGTAVVDPLLSTSGSWSGVFSWPLIGIQSLLTPDGKILSYGTDQAGLQGAYKIYDVWDPITNTHNTLPNKTFTDEFCSAAEIIPQTGDVILTGGDARPLGSVNTGVADTNIFDYKTDSLTPNPSGPMAFARWYPTLITLGTGQLLILGGRDFSGNGVGYPEIFTPGDGWRTLTGAYIAEIANGSGWYYPRAWQASDGKVIAVAAGGSTVYAIDPSGNGQVSAVGQAPVSLDFGEPAIMFAQDRCLILGSDGSVWVMDISGPTPVFTSTGALAPDRIWSNLTVLPDGRVMVSGGSAVDSNNNPSLSVTDADNTVAIWDPSTGLWTSTGANAAVPRLYHSSTILLPDATILSLGGGGLDPNEPSMNHLNGEIYTPGYLFDANGAAAVRPVIQQAPLDLSPGQTFTVRVDNPANIRTLALMPFGSTTHSFNTTARRIELSFSVQADGSLSVTLPVNSDVVPPGDWMLFAIGNNGTPSIASTVQVNPYLSLSSTLGTDTGSTATITSRGTTKDNTLALSGTLSVAKGFGSVQVYDGTTLLGPATVSSGNWSYTTPALLDGSHSFTARATDNAGNTTTTFAVTATVDTTPPTETISTTINTDTGATTTITSGGVTKDNTLGLSGTVSDASGVSSVQIYDGATLLGPALLTGGYTAGYAFNESSGTTTADTTGHGITGTLVNGATFTTAGKYGNAVALNGVNGYVDLGNPAALQLTGSMTVSAWINATAFPGDDAAVVSNKLTSVNAGFQLDTTADTGRRTIGFKLTNSSGGDMIRYGATTLQPNTWYNIAGVYDAAAQTLHVYLNGQLDDGQLLGTVTATQQSSSLDVEIGQRPGSPGAFQFNGRIDDVRIADHAIAQSQIQTDMATPLVAGGWSYTTAALLDGSHSFTAKATDNAGNTTTTSAVTATVDTGQVDTTPPTETISTTINTDTGATTTITSGGVTKDNTLGLSGTVSDANGVSSVQVYDGATLLGAATVSSGNWNYTTPARLDGSHSFTAKATDNAGNTTTTSAVTATVDTTAPTETISTTIITDTGATGTITSGGVTKDNTLGLSGTVSDASGVSSVQVYDGATLLGAATVSSGNWSYTTPARLDGSHSFTAKATDNAGNTTTTSAVTATVNTGQVDTTPPTETISTTINTDTGATTTITSGGVTKDNTLGLSGTVSDASGVSSVQVYDGATLLGPATVSSGNWSYTTPALLDGSHSFTAKATDNAGNTTTTSAVTATVDTTPPTETISTTINTDTGATATITSGGVTKDNTLGLSGTVSDAGGVSSVQIYDGATLLGPALLTGGYTAGYAFNESSGTTTADTTGHGITGTLVNGATFTTAGKYGNAVALNGVNGYVDLGNPAALQLTGSMTVSAWINATAFPSDDAAVVSRRDSLGHGFQLDTTADTGRRTIGFKLTNSSGGDMIRYGATTLQPNTWYNIAGVYDAAAQTLHVYLNGQLDDGQLLGTVTATQQTSALDVEIGQRPGNPGVFQFNGRIDDVRIADHAIAQSQVQTDMATPVVAGGWSYTTAALLDGSHSFTAKATDSAGNTTTTSAVTATVDTGQVDTTPPTETISTTINTDTGATTTITSGGVTKDNTLGLSGTVSDANGVSSVQVYDGATLLGAATVSSGNWNYTTPARLDGSHSFTAKATDNAGNTTTTSAVTATVDTTAPTETISTTIITDTGATGTITSGGVTKDNTLGLSGTVSDASGVSSVQVYDGATLLGAATIISGNWSYTTPARLDGSHSFTAKATDNAGNTTTTSAVTATVDTTPPALSGIVASPATANLNAGKTVTLTANFSEVVAVGSGMPTLNLNDGGTATYVSGSSSSALTFTYTIAAGQNTSDLQVNGFSGATIQDGAGNSANLSGITAANPVNPTGTLKIDTTAPTVISVVASPSTGKIATGKTVNIKLNVSENVTVATGAGSPALLLNDGGTATYTSGSGTKALTFTYTVPANQGTADLQVVGIILPSADSIHDLAGNNANLSGAAADLKLKIDTVTTTASGATISGAQTLELFGASAENITFSAGSTGTLRLDAATSFSGTVSGLALGNALDLANVAYTAGMTVGYQPNTSGPAGGLLTVGLANIALLGSYMASMFVASSDGQGGTIVVDPPPTSTTQSAILTGASISDLTLNSSFKGKGAPINVLSVTATNITIGETATSSPQVITVTDPPAGTTGSAATVRDGLHAPSLAFLGGNHEVGGEGGGQANFPDLPKAALANAIDHLPTFLGGNHEVGGEGGGQANFPDLPQAALDNAIDRLPTFLGGNHELFTNYMAAFGGSGSEHGPFETTNSANPPPDEHPLLTYPHA